MQTYIVYVHLIAVCVAVGVLLTQDFALAKTRGRPLSGQESQELRRSAKIISTALIALWISGLALVVNGYLGDPNYLANPKLWAKFGVVSILTLNGVLLHHFSFPRVVSSCGLVGLGNRDKVLVVVTGVVSTVSWLFACYLGIARPWNYSVGLGFIALVYVSLLLPSCVFGSGIALSLSPARTGGPKPFKEPRARHSEPMSLAEQTSKT